MKQHAYVSTFVLILLATLFPFHAEAHAAEVRTIHLHDTKIARISVDTGGTVINFPVKPTKVIIGRKDFFDIEYVENDIAIAPKGRQQSTNLFVYLLGRRFNFQLVATGGTGDKVVIVRDLKGFPND